MPPPLPKAQAAQIRTLGQKKQREERGLFTVEGRKSVLELARSGFALQTLVCTEPFWTENGRFFDGKKCEVFICSQKDLESISQFNSADAALAVSAIPPQSPPRQLSGLTLALDRISDPGNLGTILRTADWFGLNHLLASENTVDFYNPKVLQASMGSFCRVAVSYVNLADYLKSAGQPVMAAHRDGAPVHAFAFPKDCVLVLGSESHGISPALMELCQKSVGIPSFGGAESLNVAATAAIFCDNYRRATASK